MYFATGPCFVCAKLFSFNPELVPSYEGRPICEDCITTANALRTQDGRELWPVDPRAYEPSETLG